jgi:predicted DNA-binding transcriptional regulator YafY
MKASSKAESKAERLLRLLQTLRRHRYPVSGKFLSEELGISLRTLYRDIAALCAQGARIDGSPGVGYLLRPGFLLPPLMLTHDEIAALVLGSRWVARHADPELKNAAENLLAKVETVLPAELRHELTDSGLMVGPPRETPLNNREIAVVREAIRTENKLRIRYHDLAGEETLRVVWPFALGYFERSLVLAAWCELRQDYRHFRTDGIREMTELAEKYPRSRVSLLQEWRVKFGIPGRIAKSAPSPDTADRS